MFKFGQKYFSRRASEDEVFTATPDIAATKHVAYTPHEMALSCPLAH